MQLTIKVSQDLIDIVIFCPTAIGQLCYSLYCVHLVKKKDNSSPQYSGPQSCWHCYLIPNLKINKTAKWSRKFRISSVSIKGQHSQSDSDEDDELQAQYLTYEKNFCFILIPIPGYYYCCLHVLFSREENSSISTHAFVTVLFRDFLQLFSVIVNEIMIIILLFIFLEHGCLTTKVKYYLYAISEDLKLKQRRRKKIFAKLTASSGLQQFLLSKRQTSLASFGEQNISHGWTLIKFSIKFICHSLFIFEIDVKVSTLLQSYQKFLFPIAKSFTVSPVKTFNILFQVKFVYLLFQMILI